MCITIGRVYDLTQIPQWRIITPGVRLLTGAQRVQFSFAVSRCAPRGSRG